MEKDTEEFGGLPTQVLTERLPNPAAPLPPVASVGQPQSDIDDPVRAAKRLERLGGGGFGEVWRVRYLGSEEAWKYIPIRPGSSERTGREAVHARRVDHQNVVRVLDVIKLEDHYVLRMDLVRGRDFFRVVNEDGVLPPSDAVAYGVQVAAALQYAHEQGVVHLDLKPHNLILTEDSARVMVTDFGISASLAQERRDLPGPEAGTPFFMAPEQFKMPGEVGSAVDIWSLGVTLYWCLSLSYPFNFEGRKPGQVIQEDPVVPLAEVAPHVPPVLCRVIHSMLEKDPAKRPGSMAQVVAELRVFHEAPGNAAARKGDHALALCHFDAAMEHYKQAARRKDEEGERAARLLVLASDGKAEHDAQAARIQERLDGEDLPGALLLLTNARRRFSRSAQLREQYQRLAKEIVNLFGAPRRSIERDLRRAMFADARRYLELLASLLTVPGARRILRSAGEEAVLEDAVVQLLKISVDQAQSTYNQLQTSIEDSIQAMDFARARDTMEELQNRFPLPENVERMRRFAAAAESLAIISEFPFELLPRIATREVKASADQPFLLVKAETKCQELLKAFDPRLYPIFEEIQQKSAALNETVEKLRAHSVSVLEAIKKSHRAGNLEILRRELESAGDIILHTDIYTKEVREQVREIKRQLEALTERSDRLYREGRESLERRQFNKAIAAFEEALRLGGSKQTDIDALILTSSQSAERRRRLAENLQALDLAIQSQGGSLADVAVFLEETEEFLQLQEDPKHGDTIARASAVLATAVDLARKEAARLPAHRKLDSLKELAAAVTPASPQLLKIAIEAAADLPRRLESLVETVLEPHASATSSPPEARLLELKEVGATLAAMEPLLSSDRTASERHPAWQVSERIRGLILSSWEPGGGAVGELLAREAEELLAHLSTLAPAPVSERIKLERKRIVERLRKSEMARRARVAFRGAWRIALPLALSVGLAAGAIFGEKAFQRWREDRSFRETVEAVKKDARWSALEGLVPRGAAERGQSVALFRRDLPAFSALDGLPDPGRRFWARCVEGARILAVVAFQPAMNPDGNAVRQPVVETLRNDLETAVEAWVAQATPPLSGTETGPDRGLRAVAFRLAVAESILGALQSHQPAGDEGLRLVVERAVELQKKAQTLVTMADSVPGLAAELWSSSADARARSAAAFWQRYLELRSMAPSKAWQKLLDCQTIFFLCDALRERPPWAVEEGQAAAAYEVLKLIALIRDKSGPLPLDASWSEKADPFYKVFWRVLR